MGARCILCQRPAIAWHHLTGRAVPRGAYLDKSLVVPLCQRHHDREHELLRREGADFPGPGTDLVGHRLARVLSFMGRCGEADRSFALGAATPYGNAVAGLHALLHDELSERSPTDHSPGRQEVSA